MRGLLIIMALFFSNHSFCQFELLDSFGLTHTGSAITSIDCLNGNCLVLNSDEIGLTLDRGETFQYRNSPIFGLDGHHAGVQMLDTATYFVSARDQYLEYSIYLTEDGSDNWILLYDDYGDTINGYSFTMFDTKRGMVACDKGRIVRSEAQFIISDTIALLPSTSEISDLLLVNDSTAVATHGKHIYITNTFGNSWMTVEEFTSGVAGLISRYGDSTINVAHYGATVTNISRSTDFGDQWTSYGVTNSEFEVRSAFHFANDSLGLAIGSFNTTVPILFFTKNSGLDWDTVHIPYLTAEATTLELVNDSTAFVGGFDGTLLRVNLLELTQWLPPDTTIGMKELETGKMLSVFPNPSQGSNNIRLELIQPTRVNIDLYDSQGRFVQHVWTGTMAEGQHEVHSDLSGIGPGIYIYVTRLKSEVRTAMFMRD